MFEEDREVRCRGDLSRMRRNPLRQMAAADAPTHGADRVAEREERDIRPAHRIDGSTDDIRNLGKISPTGP